MDEKLYDIVVVGGGPAGLSASIYALRSGKSVLMLEKAMVGGQSTYSNDIDNYPGFEHISGADLAMTMLAQATALGLEVCYTEVTKFHLKDKIKTLQTIDGDKKARAVILALGAKARLLGADNEEKFTGRGVSYCAVCDGNLYKGKEVVLVGNGDTAVEDAMYLCKVCKKVTILIRSSVFKCKKTLEYELNDAINEYKNIEVLRNITVTKILGDDVVTGVECVTSEGCKSIPCSGVFVAVGRVPDTLNIKGEIETDTSGYIVSNERMQTSVEGVFVAGDVRVKTLRQVVTACADGAIAGTEASIYLK